MQRLDVKWKGITVLTYIQAPFASVASLEESVYTVMLNNADSAFAVRETEEFLYRRTSHGLTPINPERRVKSDFDIIYTEAPTSTAARTVNFKTGSLTGAKISYFVIPKNETFFIHTKRDLEIANLLKQNFTLKTNAINGTFITKQ